MKYAGRGKHMQSHAKSHAQRQQVNFPARQWLDLHGAINYAAVSRRTLLTWIYRGLLPAFKVRGKWYLRRKDFDAFFENHRAQATVAKADDREGEPRAWGMNKTPRPSAK